VLAAVRAWAKEQAGRHAELLRLGVFGSYARGDAGVGSDVDLVALVRTAPRALHERTLGWPTETLPVPADLLVLTEPEWQELLARPGRFGDVLRAETVWVYPPAG
jgi:predicted nucleotidyltransferase